MNLRSFSNISVLTLLALIFVALAYLNNTYLRGYKVDFTEDKIYSLSDASKAIIDEIDQPIQLTFFFSDSTSKGYISLRDYAKRVQSLLTEYSQYSKGKIKLDVINPEPFSEQEDKAASFGLTSPTVGVAQDAIYFGLAGTNSNDDTFIIGFFDPQKEPFLEYDISSLLYKLSNPDLPKLTIVSDLSLAGGQNPLTGQSLLPNVVFQQLNEFFDVELISNSDEQLPHTDVLLLWHPQGLNQNLLYQVDQFIMSSQPTVILFDPHYESDPMAQMGSVGANSSELPLLESYGINTNDNFIVLDPLTGIEVTTFQSEIARHLGYLGLSEAQINRVELITSDLEAINGASFGALDVEESSKLVMTSLLTSSEESELMEPQQYASTNEISLLRSSLNGKGIAYTLAARFTGTAESHFNSVKLEQANASQNNINADAGPEAGELVQNATEETQRLTVEGEASADEEGAQTLPVHNESSIDFTDMIESSQNINVLVIADADMAADRFWVQQSNFFGQTVLSPFANNSDLLTNIIDNMSGSEQMIGIRGQGTFARPFQRVQSIRTKAEEKFRAQEQRLQEQLEQTELQLQELQTQSDSITLNDEQQQAIDNFTQQKIEIRKSLRDVQFELEREINQLGNYLKLANIVYAPVALTILLLVLARLLKRRY